MTYEGLLSVIEEAQILGLFKDLCNYYSEYHLKNKLRNILANSSSEIIAIKQIIRRRYNENISNEQLEFLHKLIVAFLKKSEYRKAIGFETKNQLLNKQNWKCAFCKCDIDISAHADHIIPFKYVGDELDDNLQMLCSKCNEKKKDSMDYQIRFLLKLV